MKELEFSRELSRLYRIAVKLEEKTIKNDKNRANLTVNELNIIECIKALTKNHLGPTISAIASELDITRPSTTVAVNKLVSKKYVEKTESSEDGRSVRVSLTQKGEKAYSVHKNYHNQLIRETREYFSEKEYADLSEGFEKIKTFFSEKLEMLDSEDEF